MRISVAALLCLLSMAAVTPPRAVGQTRGSTPPHAGGQVASRPTTTHGQTLPDDVTAVRDVEYAKVSGRSLLLDVYLPKKAARPLPLIVWIHGGAWMGGDKSGCPAVSMAARGYVVASINYRLSQEAIFPAQIEDCKAAIRFLRANSKKYSIDPQRVGVWGASAGGHLAALLGTSGGVADLEGTVGGNANQSSRVQAVADFCGPADFTLFHQAITPGAVHPLQQLLGGPPDNDKVKALAVKASPVTYVGKGAPPFLIVHGENDNTVPVSQAVALNKALKAADADVTLSVVKGAGHAVMNPDTAKLAEDFFDQHLRPGGARKPAPGATSQPVRGK